MRSEALALRIIAQLKHDRRTMALVLLAPLLVLTLVHSIIGEPFFARFGGTLIGIIVFFFVFVIAGINLLIERSSGTLEKMLSTPIRCGEIVLGYVLGFGILTVVQTVLVTVFVVYVLGVNFAGSIWYMMLVNLLTAAAALTLGMVLSTLANSEFQMVQFIPLVIIPQIFLCGLVSLSDGWSAVSKFVPLTYSTDALTEVVTHGGGFRDICSDILVLAAFSLVFLAINYLLLKKQRNW